MCRVYLNEQDSDVFSGSVTSQPQMVNVPSSAPMYMVEEVQPTSNWNISDDILHNYSIVAIMGF